MGEPVSDQPPRMTSDGSGAVQRAILIAGIGVLAVIAYGDVRTRRIPNALSVAIATLGLMRIILDHDPVQACHTVAAAAAIFAVAFLLFWRGAIGGGDAKLLAAMALFVGYHDLFNFLYLMSLCGGALALAILARDKFRPSLWRPAQLAKVPSARNAGCTTEPADSSVPYGVAIAAAGVITLIL
jgi:prepilin peptidase CpaA